MNRRRVITWSIAAVVLVVLVGAGVWTWLLLGGGRADIVSAPTTARVQGATAIDTALELSREGWQSADAVVLIAEDDAAAAAVAGPLAVAVGGPVLLTESDTLTVRVAERLRELGAKRIFVLGRADSISDSVVEDAKAIAPTEPLIGADEYAMAEAAAHVQVLLSEPSGAVIVPSDAEDIGVVVSGLAAAYGSPVVFARPSGEIPISAQTAQALSGGRVLVIAGEDLVSDDAVVNAGLSPELIERLPADAGVEQFAAAFAEYAFAHGFEYRTVFAARASDAAHAYALAPLAAQEKYLSPLVVTADDALGAETERFFTDHASSIQQVRFLGTGGDSAKAVEDAARAAAETRISRDAVVVDDALSASMSSYTTGTVTFTESAQVRDVVKRGRYLVAGPSASAPSGFIVKVDAVERTGDELTARVSQASLDDVVIKGSFDVRLGSYVATDPADQPEALQEPDAEPRVIAASYSPQQSPAVLTRVAQIGDRSTKVGRLIFTVPVDMGEFSQEKEVWTKEGKLPVVGKVKEKVKVGVSAQASGKLTITLIASATWVEEQTPAGGFRDLIGIKTHGRLSRFFMQSVTEIESKITIEGGASFAVEKKGFQPWDVIEPTPLEKQLKLKGVPIGQTVVFIGVVPIHLSSDAEPVGKLDGKFAAKISFETTSKRSYATQFMYSADDPKPFSYEATQRKTPADWSIALKGSATGRVGVGVKVNLKIDGIIGPYVQALGYGKAVAKGSVGAAFKDGKPPQLEGKGEVAIKVGVEPSVGGTLEVLGTTLGETSWKPSEEFIEKYLELTLWKIEASGTVPVGGGEDDATKKAAARQRYDIVMVVDNSGSMEYDAAPGVPRFKNGQDAVIGLLDAVSEPAAGIANKVGFVSYAEGIGESQPLTDAYQEVEAASLRLIPVGGTNMEAGLNAGIDHLQFGEAPKRVLILVSDGAANTGAETFEEFSAPGGVLERARTSDIEIWAIGYGTNDSGDWNPELLRQIANYTGGEAFIEEPVKDVGNKLALRMIGITERASGADVIAEKTTALVPGQTAELSRFTVSPQQAGKTVEARVLVGANEQGVDIWLVDPEGVEVAAGLYPDAEVTEGRALKRFVVPSAMPGEYRVYTTTPSQATADTSSSGEADASVSTGGASAQPDPTAEEPSSDAGADSGVNGDGTVEEATKVEPGVYIVASVTPTEGDPREAEQLPSLPATVLPAWFWPGLGLAAFVLLAFMVVSLLVRKVT